MDSVMLGSLHTYRRWLTPTGGELGLWGHGVAGAMAGFTVSFVAAPIEHVKVPPARSYKGLIRRGYRSSIRIGIEFIRDPLTLTRKLYSPGTGRGNSSTCPMGSGEFIKDC
jgi:hypothetical protein